MDHQSAALTPDPPRERLVTPWSECFLIWFSIVRPVFPVSTLDLFKKSHCYSMRREAGSSRELVRLPLVCSPTLFFIPLLIGKRCCSVELATCSQSQLAVGIISDFVTGVLQSSTMYMLFILYKTALKLLYLTHLILISFD